MTALYLPVPIQTRTLPQTLTYLAEQAFRAVGILIGSAGIVLVLVGLFGATS